MYLGKRERIVICGIMDGKTNQEIANEIRTSLQCVKNVCSRLYLKAGVKSREELAKVIDNDYYHPMRPYKAVAEQDAVPVGPILGA